MRTNTPRTNKSRNAKVTVCILACNSIANAYLVKLSLKEPRIRLLPPPRNGHGAKPVVFVLPLEPSVGAAQARLSALRRSFPRSRFLLTGKAPTAEQIFSLLRAGAHGFVAVDKIESQFHLAIKEVWSGNTWLSSQDLAPKNSHLEAPQPANGGFETVLTQRQTQVAELARRGFSNKQIASEIGISERTVKFHLKNTFLKFGVSDRHALAAVLASAQQPGQRSKSPA